MHRTALPLAALAIACATLLHHPLCGAVEALAASASHERAIQSLLIMPMGVLGIVFLRAVVGLETFGVFAPLILAFAFARVGPPLGAGLFLAMLLFATPVRQLLERVPFLSVARTGVLVVSCAILLLLLTAYGPALIPDLGPGDMGLPIVALAGMLDRFVTAQMDQSPGEAIRLSAYTLVTAFLISLLVGWERLHGALRGEPDLLFLVPPLCLLAAHGIPVPALHAVLATRHHLGRFD